MGFGVVLLPVSYLTSAISEAILWYIVVACALFTIAHLVIRLIIQARSIQEN
jgi:hypothetical protein